MKYCKSVVADTLRPLPESLTVCATVDESGNEHIVTELMIRRACEQIDSDQIWPIAGGICTGSLRKLPTRGTATIIQFPARAH